MDLTGILLMLLPVFLVPAFFLPHNKIRYYTICSGVSSLVVITLCLISLWVPQWNISTALGNAFYPMFSWLLNAAELSQVEVIHLSFFLTMAFFYGSIYFILYLSMKHFYIGTNPDIHKPAKAFSHGIMIAVFFLSTYGMLFWALVEIREILPIRDGILSALFAWIYPLEA